VVRGVHDAAPDLREDPTRTSDLSGPEPDPSPIATTAKAVSIYEDAP